MKTEKTTQAAETAEPTAEQQALQTRLQQAIDGWTQADSELTEAQEAERSAPKPSAARTIARKARLSAGARKANRRTEISNLELDLRLTGAEVTPWQEPERPKSAITRYSKTPDEIRGELERVRALLADGQLPDSVQHTAHQRIKALQAAAERQGVTLS